MLWTFFSPIYVRDECLEIADESHNRVLIVFIIIKMFTVVTTELCTTEYFDVKLIDLLRQIGVMSDYSRRHEMQTTCRELKRMTRKV